MRPPSHPEPAPPRDMTPEEFRAYGHKVVDWVADYRARIEEFPVLSQVRPGEIAAAMPASAPSAGEPFDAVLADLDRLVLPGITHWQHPSFFGYFPANASGPAVLGDLVSSGLGVQGMLWATSPACTEVESVVVDWLAELLGLPDRFRAAPGAARASAPRGSLQDSASSATLVALLAALYRASDGTSVSTGVGAADYTVYTSDQGHSSIEKAVRIAGLGSAAVRLIRTDPDTLALDVAALRAAVDADVAAGARPALVVATVGTTASTAIDPLPSIADVCAQAGAWLHVDAAYAGVAAVCPELRWIHTGLDRADSYCTDPHKWLLTNFDCDVLWVADPVPLAGALSILPEYLRNAATEAGDVVDYRDWQVPLGRRFRALKLWFVLRWFGADGVRAHIRGHVALAAEFAAAVAADPRFEVSAPHPLGLVCFRLTDAACGGRAAADEANARLLAGLNASGAVYLTHARLRGEYTLRLAIGAIGTEARHTRAAWELIRAAASRDLGDPA